MTQDLKTLLWLSRPLMQRIEAKIETDLTGTGLTVRMRAVLEILAERGPLPVPDIAHALEVQRQYVQVMVNDTLSAGLTEKRPNPRHARSPLIALTETGQTLIDEVLAKEAQTVAALAEGLDDADIATALRVARHCHQILRDMT
ncbi:MarR family winged helix-turn-helix transcriptional regulator [Aliiroseovarius crassostreae]|uniref:MarR family winged helix-turn-helix transcriptional regulator n=1 Tax=Aliiroseovarius crassostreae TaxID=154981 RepID=UPI003C7DD1CC